MTCRVCGKMGEGSLVTAEKEGAVGRPAKIQQPHPSCISFQSDDIMNIKSIIPVKKYCSNLILVVCVHHAKHGIQEFYQRNLAFYRTHFFLCSAL